jgi:hypothetical protein
MSAGLFCVAIMSGIALADYVKSGFSFYKHRKQAALPEQLAYLRSDAATTPLSTYSAASTPEDPGWGGSRLDSLQLPP